MFELISAYIEYLSSLKQIVRPQMPKIEPEAYTDSEYKIAIRQLENDYAGVDDFDITIKFLKGKI